MKITENECLKALKKMKNNKSHGSDELTVEFIKVFWNTIKQYYVNSINLFLRKRSLNGATKTRYNYTYFQTKQRNNIIRKLEANKSVKVDWTFELFWDPLLTISPNLFFWKQPTVRSLQSK